MRLENAACRLNPVIGENKFWLITHSFIMQTEDYADLYALEEDFWWFTGMREITASLLDPHFRTEQDRLILDVGCGTGGNLVWLKPYARNGSVFGLDLVTDALKFCSQRESERLAQATVTDLPFTDETFDLVTSFDVLEQLPGENADDRAICEMYRVLRENGICFVRVPAYEWMRSGHDTAMETQRRYTLSQLRKKMEQASFQILRATYANSLLLPLAAFRRLVLKRLRLSDPGSDVKPLSPRLKWMNRVLNDVLCDEARLLRRPKARLPVGLSAICVARKSLSRDEL
jgi:ubiquinone/menaquinone biosynthesis C-methylase UbiE